MSESNDPHTRDELTAALENVHREVGDFFGSLPHDDLYRRPGEDVWSPAENLVHLNKSVKAVASGLAMPRLVLRVLFGKARKPSRRFQGVVDVYLEQLARGARATGPYVPPRFETTTDAAAEITRMRMLSGWGRAGSLLVRKLEKWNETSLDKYRLPHPLLGKLTVREMLFFTIYHDRHHLTSVRKRLGDARRQGDTPS